MWGSQYRLPFAFLCLFILNNYMVGQRISVGNIKVAGGIFKQDKYLALLQSVVNLGVSVLMAIKLGLVGVYIGTIVSGLIPSVLRPFIVYKNLFDKRAIEYYISYLFRLCLTAIMCFGGYLCVSAIMVDLSWIRFFIAVAVIGIVPNLIYFCFILNLKSLSI
jgi:peptidoglycan biosynthesis protein MviN/MurJ (putative lipid II flippase)